MLSFSIPHHYYSPDFGPQVGWIERSMSTEGGKPGKCIVFSSESKPLNTLDCEAFHGSFAHLNTEMSASASSSNDRQCSPDQRRRRSRSKRRNSPKQRTNSRSKRTNSRSSRRNSRSHVSSPRCSSRRNRNFGDNNDIETVRLPRRNDEETRHRRSRSSNRGSRARPPLFPKREIKYEDDSDRRRCQLRSPTPPRSRERQYKRSVDYLETKQEPANEEEDRKNDGPNEPLKHEDIFGELLPTEKYDVYTASGLSALENASEETQKSLDEYKKGNTDKKKKGQLSNTTENIEWSMI